MSKIRMTDKHSLFSQRIITERYELNLALLSRIRINELKN